MPIWESFSHRVILVDTLVLLSTLKYPTLFAYSSRFYNDTLAIWCQALPQLLFLVSIFGYLVITIFYKWCAYTADEASTAPSLLLSKCFLVPH